MTTLKVGAYGTAVTVLATELNSLASGSVSGVSGSGTGTIFDNSSNLNLFIDLVLTITFGSAPTAGNTLGAFIARTLDLTNYDVVPAAGTTLPQAGSDLFLGNFVLQTAGTTQILTLARKLLTPGKWKFQLVNSSGVALPASGSTLAAYPYAMTSA